MRYKISSFDFDDICRMGLAAKFLDSYREEDDRIPFYYLDPFIMAGHKDILWVHQLDINDDEILYIYSFIDGSSLVLQVLEYEFRAKLFSASTIYAKSKKIKSLMAASDDQPVASETQRPADEPDR